MVTTVSALPTPPSRGSSASTFSADADAFMDALPTFRSELNQLATDLVAFTSGLDFNGTSATSTTIGTGSKTFTTQAGKLWQVGQFVIVARTSAPANYMFGQVTGYSGTSLTVNVTATGGSGAGITDWSIGMAATGGITATSTDTLQNKSIALGSNTLTGTLAQFNMACSDADFAAAGWALIGTLTTTSGTSQAFTSIPQTYADLLVVPATSYNSGVGEALRMDISDNNGTNYSGSFSTWSQAAADTVAGQIFIPGYRLSTGIMIGSCPAFASNRTLNMRTSVSSGAFGLADWRADAGINALRFTWSGGGPFDAGTIKLYGR